MQFDEIQYAQQFMRKLRGARTLPDDLLERYAIALPATDAEIADQLKRVREYWIKVSGNSSFVAQAAKMCRAEDERFGTQYGDAMLTRSWWEARQADSQFAAQASITRLAEALRQDYGPLGVVTASTLDGLATRLGLSRTDAARAATEAGLTAVEGIELPESEPFSGFSALIKSMSECAASSVPELVHPGSGPFKLIDSYICIGDPTKRLDVVAVDAQSTEADKRGVSATENARRAALKLLRRASKEGVDLRDVALFQMVTIARELMPSMSMAAEELQQAGLDSRDAAVLAVLLADRISAGAAAGVGKVRSLLAAGRLNEALQFALTLPTGLPDRAEVIRELDAARDRLAALLAQARQAQQARDEVGAAVLLKEAAAISIEDAQEALATVPLAPPTGLRAVCEAAEVMLFWQPAPGHGAGTSYVVTRTERRRPTAIGDGKVAHKGTATSCADSGAPVARPVQYGIFATEEGRPESRPAIVAVTLLPPVAQLQADVGPSRVTLCWSANPAAEEVRVTRVGAGGRHVPVPVRGNSCQVAELTEGVAQYFEVTAVYRAADGAYLSSAAIQISATPRAKAQPIPKLRVSTRESDGSTRVKVTWTPIDSSEVHILRSDIPSPWQFGTWVSEQQMAGFGTELTGHRIAGRSEASIEADLPVGVHHLIPFSRGGNGIVAGEPTKFAVVEPVRHLAVTPFADYATVSWEWPQAAQLARLSWTAGGGTSTTTIGQGEYRSGGGARVPLGGGPYTVEVNALVVIDGVTYQSPTVRHEVKTALAVAISYSVSGGPAVGPFRGRTKKVVFSCDEPCQDVRVQMVATSGRVMPASADGGILLLDTTLALQPGRPAEHRVTVPVKRPYWVRCFVVSGQGRLIDPPISSLKEA